MQTFNATGKPTIEPGFYVTAIDGARCAFVAGPFETHEEALRQVEPEREKWTERDPRAHWAAWGTARRRES